MRANFYLLKIAYFPSHSKSQKVIKSILSNAFFVSILLNTSVAQSRTNDDIEKALLKAAKASVATYKASGMSGLIDKTQGCYNNLNKYKFYCVYLDLASKHIDQESLAGTTFPPTEFFTEEQFRVRADTVFAKANMDTEQANDYLAAVTSIINKLVNDNLHGEQAASAHAPTTNALVKNATKISALGFPKKWLKAPIYLRSDKFNPPSHFVIFESLLDALLENSSFSKITSIKSGKYEGVLIKIKGAESNGFLFKYDDGDLFISHIVNNEQSTPVETVDDYLSLSLMIFQLAPDAVQRIK